MLVVLFLLVVAAAAGFVVGRDSAQDDSPAVAETTGGATTETATTEETETEPTPTEAPTETGAAGEDGASVFAEAGCGGCHRFQPAGSSGSVGPPLDGIDLSKDEIAEQVRSGGGGMPAFGDRLSEEQIEAVADYVENAG